MIEIGLVIIFICIMWIASNTTDILKELRKINKTLGEKEDTKGG